MSVLVVDDDAAIRMLFRALLEAAGLSVDEAADGEEALLVIGKSRPEVVLLDVMMPKLDGWQVLEALRANEETDELPVIMITALADPDTQRRSLASGANRFLPKPVSSAELVAAVKELMAGSRIRS